MKKYFVLLSSLFFLFAGITELLAVQANPNPIKVKQPDGTEITIYINGDEFYSWYEDADGYTVVKNPQTKYFSYAKQDSFGDLKPTEHIVGKVSPKMLGIKESLKDEYMLSRAKESRKRIETERNKSLLKNSPRLSSLKESGFSNGSQSNVSEAAPVTGTKTNFVLLIEYNDLFFSSNPPFTSSGQEQIRQKFDDLFNKSGFSDDGAAGSAKDYFREVSYNQMNFESVVSPIVRLDYNYQYFARSLGDLSYERFRAAVAEALQKLDDSGYDFYAALGGKDPDAFTVVHAGGGAEQGNLDFVWSHQWDLASTVTVDGIHFKHYDAVPAGKGYNGSDGLIRIGVICHETLHIFGLPDLYDTTYASNGLGDFCIMAGGEWNGGDGRMPCHPSVWCKYSLGWISPQTPVEGINYIGTSSEDNTAFYVLEASKAGFPSTQYFLMENRQSSGFDKSLPGSTKGILIYHVDETLSNNDNWYRYMVDLEEADGTADWTQDHLVRKSNKGLDSDYYRSGTVTVFNDGCVSSPNSRSYEGNASGINIAGISASSSNMAFAYGNVDVEEDLSNVLSYPNPAKNGYMYITNLPLSTSDFSAEVFTMKGNLVKHFSQSDIDYVNKNDTIFGKIKWLLKNDGGDNVAPGVYIIMIKSNDKIKKYKVAITR